LYRRTISLLRWLTMPGLLAAGDIAAGGDRSATLLGYAAACQQQQAGGGVAAWRGRRGTARKINL